jgi:hypothetical protein
MSTICIAEGKSMLELLLSHWASYLFMAWFAVVLVVNLWPRKKRFSGQDGSQKAKVRDQGIRDTPAPS